MAAETPIPYLGEIASLTAAFIWAGSMSVFSRFGRDASSATLNLYKNLVALVCLLIAGVTLRPDLPHPPFEMLSTFAVLAASGIIGISIGDTALFAALRRLGPQVTSASQCLAPPLAAIIAWLCFAETLTLFEILGMMLTVTGIVLLIQLGRPRRHTVSALNRHLTDAQRAEHHRSFMIGLAWAVLSAGCQGAGIVMSRYALQEIPVIYGTAARMLPAALVLIGFGMLRGRLPRLGPVFANRRTGTMLTLASFAGTFLGLLLLSTGAKYAKAGIVGALSATYPVWIIPIAYFVLKEPVRPQAVVCTLIAVLGIILMTV